MLRTDSIDVASLCLNINETTPSGVNPRLDVSPTSAYFKLKDLRNALRANERNLQADGESILVLAKEWQPLVDQISHELATNTKDLEYVAWLIEALCRLQGFHGLASGFSLALELASLYWDTITPEVEDEPLDKILPLVGLNGIEGNGTLISPIKEILITQCNAIDYSLWQYEQAVELERLDNAKKQKRIDSGVIQLEKIRASANETSSEFFISLFEDLNNAIASFSKLSSLMDERTNQATPTSHIMQTLVAAKAAVKQLAGDMLNEKIVEVDSLNGEDESNTMSESSALNHSNSSYLSDRESALTELANVANYFRKAEPHSPISYAIEQVIRWSKLSLPELLTELISNEEARNGYFKLSGIKEPDSNS